MYVKLALRNAKRSLLDYLLYSFTATILIAILCASNCIAALGKAAAGLQTVSLPLLIVAIMVVLIDAINDFMVKQRAKEFATYMLLGMEQRKLSMMFFLELSVIGIVCFVLGVVLGEGVYCLSFYSMRTTVESRVDLWAMASGVLQTLVYFCIIQLLSALRMRQKLYKLQIHQLMNKKRQNEPLKSSRPAHWSAWLIVSLSTFFAMLCGVVFMPKHQGNILLSLLAVPMLCSVFVFYKWVYAYYSAKRAACTEELYQGTRLYRIAEMTSNARASAVLNFIFCCCLLFSAAAFVFGVLLLNPGIFIFLSSSQQWMGVLQISICIIFMVIFFSVLSLLQIVERRQQAGHLKILHCMGKSEKELRALVRAQILIRLFLPTVMCFVLLGISAPLVNRKLNAFLPVAMHNLLFRALGGFGVCFVVLYISYFLIVNTIAARGIARGIK